MSKLNKEDWKEAGAASDGKADNGKIRMSLLLTQFGELVKDVAEVLTFGAAKYPKPPMDDGWRQTPNGFYRYQDAAYRHLSKFLVEGERNDPESGVHHLAHAIADILIVHSLAETDEKAKLLEEQNK